MSDSDNPMRTPKIDKVVVHMGVGESGQTLVNAEQILQTITGQSGVRTYAKRTQPAFGIRKREPIGCKVTLRGKRAQEFLETSLSIVENRLDESQFDESGNVAFGIDEHTDFSGMKYDPNIGIFGMDIMVVVTRPGYRIKDRKVESRKIPGSHKIVKEDSIEFFKDKYSVEVV